MRLIPGRLKAARRRALLGQVELAERIGVAASTINRIETGHQTPRLSTVRKLAEALHVTPDELVAWDEDDDAEPD
jgi:transcriptional regulator with XRE-family HTH domain